MTDQRPQFGEYATPEEQRRLAGLPPLDAAIDAPAVVEPAAQVPTQAPAQSETPKPRRWDRILTIGLLAYGLVTVFVNGLAYLDLPTLMNKSMKMVGIDGEFTNFAQGKLWGTIAAVVLVIGWVITTLIAIRRLRTGKLTWWVPLVGAVVTMIVVGICVMIPMIGDPAFLSFSEGISNGG